MFKIILTIFTSICIICMFTASCTQRAKPTIGTPSSGYNSPSWNPPISSGDQFPSNAPSSSSSSSSSSSGSGSSGSSSSNNPSTPSKPSTPSSGGGTSGDQTTIIINTTIGE